MAFGLALLPLGAFAQETPTEPPRLDVDISIPRVHIRPPVYEPTLKIYEALPSRLYFSSSLENSYRLETNPYQAPLSDLTHPFIKNTGVYRLQGDATVGYAFTPRTRLSLNYFLLSNRYDNFTSFRLFGGTRLSLGKPAVFTTNLAQNPAKTGGDTQ